MSEGLSCVCYLALAWQPAPALAAERERQQREAALLLTAVNQMEASHDQENSGPENRRLERLEAKLDLALHLLARNLEPKPPACRHVTLTPQGAEWEESSPPAEEMALMLALRLSDRLPLSIHLPALALAPQNGMARVRFLPMPEELEEAWVQFVFRRHRQAIRAR